MPKAPILRRTRFFDTLRDGTIIFLDWNAVVTSLGTMMEPVSLVRMGTINNEDVADSNFNDLQALNRDQLYSLTNVGGELWPRNYNAP